MTKQLRKLVSQIKIWNKKSIFRVTILVHKKWLILDEKIIKETKRSPFWYIKKIQFDYLNIAISHWKIFIYFLNSIKLQRLLIFDTWISLTCNQIFFIFKTFLSFETFSSAFRLYFDSRSSQMVWIATLLARCQLIWDNLNMTQIRIPSINEIHKWSL